MHVCEHVCTCVQTHTQSHLGGFSNPVPAQVHVFLHLAFVTMPFISESISISKKLSCPILTVTGYSIGWFYQSVFNQNPLVGY